MAVAAVAIFGIMIAPAIAGATCVRLGSPNRCNFNRRGCIQHSKIVTSQGNRRGPAKKIRKNIGMLLLAIYRMVDGLLGFGLNLGPAIFLLYLKRWAQASLFSSESSTCYFKYLSNHATVCSSRSAWCLGSMKRWPSPG